MNTTSRSYHFSIGAIECLAISEDDEGGYAPHSILRRPLPEDALQQALHECNLQPDDIPIDCCSLLIDTGSRRILVDAGSGIACGPDNYSLPQNLHAAGVDMGTIDTVVITHAHLDHLGGTLTAAGALMYPQARHCISRREAEYWLGKPDLATMQVPDAERNDLRQRTAQYLTALAGHLEWVDDGDEIAPGVRIVAAPGHTPGHIAVAVTSGSERLFVVGDLVHLPLQCAHPAWGSIWDVDPAEAEASRRRIFARAAAKHALVMACHFPLPAVGTLTASGEGWRWLPSGNQ